MQTKILTSVDIEEAARILKKGEVLAFPTETVYGLGASVFSKQGIEKIFALKGRPSDNPLIVHLFHLDQLTLVAREVPKLFFKLAAAFIPGPLSVILKRHPNVPGSVTAGLDTVAIRMPGHPLALKLLREVGEPVAAPSANLSGRPSGTEVAHVLEDFEGKIPAVLDGGPCVVGLESTVLSLVLPDQPAILRPGAISQKEIEMILGVPVSVATSCLQKGQPASPGMKYTHYAPRAKVRLFFSQEEIEKSTSTGKHCMILAPRGVSISGSDSFELTGRDLFRHFRWADQKGVTEILVFCDASVQEDAALMNRLEKASGGSTHATSRG